MKTIGDQQLVKRINLSVIFRMIRQQPGQSRAQLATRSGLTKSTVSLLVRDLIEEGWLSEIPLSQPLRSLGRPSTPLQINGKTRGLLGVEIAVEALRVVGVSLTGEVLWSTEERLTSKNPAAICAQLAVLVERAYREMLARGVQSSGLGIGVAGVYEEAAGIVRIAPNLGWRDLHFIPLVTQALAAVRLPRLPIYVRNDADTAALSEYEFAVNEEIHSLIFVNCATGVGAGIIMNDRLYSGARGMAGEIGHSVLQLNGLPCPCGRRGCAETLFGARALATMDDPISGGYFMGLALHNLWITFDSALIVVGGYTCSKYPMILAAAQSSLEAHARDANMPLPKVRAAKYGILASAVGAAALTMHQLLRPMNAPSHADVNAAIPQIKFELNSPRLLAEV